MTDENPVTAVTVRRHLRPVVDTSADPLLTIQSAKDECDINKIVPRLRSGLMPWPEPTVGRFADVTALGDYRDLMNRSVALREYFEALPSEMREKYRNDATIFIEEIGADANRADAVQLGLIREDEPVRPSAAPVIEKVEGQ